MEMRFPILRVWSRDDMRNLTRMEECGWGLTPATWEPVVAGTGLHGLFSSLPSGTFVGSLVMVGGFTP